MRKEKQVQPCEPRAAGTAWVGVWSGALACALFSAGALAQTVAPVTAALSAPDAVTLQAVFARAWERHPQAQSQALRREAAQATRDSAAAWTVEPVALEMQVQSDTLASHLGSREYEIGLAVPLWLPGERARKAALGEAELRAVSSRRLAAQLVLAATVREAWWTLQRAQVDLVLAQDRLHGANRLAADVTRRFKAGDMSRADQTQATSAVAQAEAAVADAAGARDAAVAAISAWGDSAEAPSAVFSADAEVMPETVLPSGHPAVVDWQDQAEVARRAADLAASQTRANPELTVATTRGREQAGERYVQSLTVGIRVPFGGGDRARAREATARAEALEAEARVDVEQARLAADVAAARARLTAALAQRTAMSRHVALARDARGYVDKAFVQGEADWPTRLRVELDTVQAERKLARAGVDAAAAVSALRQALGLLPQ